MIEITWRYDPQRRIDEAQPATPQEAVALLATGNRAFASLVETAHHSHVVTVAAADLGLGTTPGSAPTQHPYAAILGCADARVPMELIFLESANSLFAVRVAGNVLGPHSVGSLDYAVSHLETVRLVAVLGHTGCGAISAAVDAYLEPTAYLGVSANLPLRAIVDAVMPVVRGSARALRVAHSPEVVRRCGYRAALTDTAVTLNAAMGAEAVRRMFSTRLGASLDVAFGVYDLTSRRVGLPGPDAGDPWVPGLVATPVTAQFQAFVAGIVTSPYIQQILDGD